MTDYAKLAVELHEKHRGKLEIRSKVPLKSRDDLSVAYTPGVATPCERIAADPEQARYLTIKQNTVAIVTDGSAVLGLGKIGPQAALPVMEGKAILFKEFADIDAWPICLDTYDPDEIVETVRRIAPGFGGINLEDIAAPACFYIERKLRDLGIPVFHDDQHGTAIVVRAALINAARAIGRDFADLKVVICGAGAAGVAIAQMLAQKSGERQCCAEVVVTDSRGVIGPHRDDLTFGKVELLNYTNPREVRGTVHDALKGADVFIGVSQPGLLSGDDVRNMNPGPIILALSNPVPEIDPMVALEAGAAVVGTGRSDYPNQVNNVLAFPGIFRGALDAHAKEITVEMRFAAARALADSLEEPTPDRILPSLLDRSSDLSVLVASAVREVAIRDNPESHLAKNGTTHAKSSA